MKTCLLLLFVTLTLPAIGSTAEPMERITLSPEGTHFIGATSGNKIVIWGVNYDHDSAGQLLEDYWHDDWSTVVEDFREIKSLGCNTVRVHLQLAKFMDSAEQPNQRNFQQLAKLVKLAEETGLYLDVTGLGCYHKQDTPAWYDHLDEQSRWQVQARFWQAVAKVCRKSNAIFCYDLMNEPILPGKEPATEWLAGELGGKHFVQRISLELGDRTREELAAAWVKKLTTAIREVDQRHLLTVGVIPWVHTFKGAKPLFYSPEVGGPLDFVSVHFYPKKGDVAGSLAALRVYEIGKPLVVEEIFPLKAGLEETLEFIDRSREYTDGYISFYWGNTIQQSKQQGDMKGAIIAAWLEIWREQAPK